MAVLNVNNVNKSYNDFIAVNDVSFDVLPGNIYGILGPNGAGKTTTIRMIMNIIAPDSGHIEIFGQKMSDQLKSKIGYLPEERGLYKKMKVIDVLIFLGELNGIPAQQAKEKSQLWLEKLNLIDQQNKRVDEFSKGMQQKVQLIGAILHEPDLIILDEPFSGLDPVNVNLVKNIMLELKNQGKAIMLSTHVMETAEKLCDEILMINHGCKVLDGKLSSILKNNSKNSIRLEFNGDGKVFQEIPIIKQVNTHPTYVELVLQDKHTISELVKLLAEKVEILSIKTMQSSLNEIFLSKAGEDIHA